MEFPIIMRITRQSILCAGAALLAGSSLLNLSAQAQDNKKDNDNAQGNEQVDTIPAGAADGLQRGVKPPERGPKTSGPANLLDHGGPVIPASKQYIIWWGPPSDFPSDAMSGMTALAQGLNNSSYLGIMQQYMRTTVSVST